MPHAVGVGLSILAAGAVAAIVAKEVIENWDEITDRYEDFADRMEDEHAVHLPRFRNRRQGYGGRSAHYSTHRSTTQDRSSQYSTAREIFDSGLTSRSERFTEHGDFEDIHSLQTSHHEFHLIDTQENQNDDDDDDNAAEYEAEFEASMRESLISADMREQLAYAQAREAQAALDRAESATPTVDSTTTTAARHLGTDNASQIGLADDSAEHLADTTGIPDDNESWSDTWTVTDGSVHSDNHHDSDHEWSGSEISYGQASSAHL